MLACQRVMIRFVVHGRPGPEAPQDTPTPFALEVDGVDLLAGRGDELPSRVVPDLVDAVAAIRARKQRAGQLSLASGQLELCLFRVDEAQIELQIVSFERPVHVVQRPVLLELDELARATAACAREVLPHLGPAAGRSLRRRLRLLEAPPAPGALKAGEDFVLNQRVDAPGALWLHARDAHGRRQAWDRRSRAHLPPLLVEGALGSKTSGLESSQPPFLTLLELSRRALEAHGGPVPLPFGGETTVQAVLELGLEFAAALVHDNPALARNPYLEVLTERCHEGLGPQAPRRRDGAPAEKRPRRRVARLPNLAAPGALRRLRFDVAWEKACEWGDGRARVHLSRAGPLVAGSHVAWAFTPRGEVRFRRMGTHGVATSPDGWVLSATSGRLACYVDGQPSAVWLRDHDDAPVGPELYRSHGQLVTRQGPRGVASFSALTGRELWRVEPPRARITAFTLDHGRALLPTDSGLFVALDLADGVARFRMRATAPLPHPMVPAGHRYLGVLAQGSATAVFSADVEAAAIAWTRELDLTVPSEPLVAQGRIYLAGEREGRPLLVALDGRGVVLWTKPLPLGGGRFAVVAAGKSVLVQDAQGSAALVERDGEVTWRVGTGGPVLSPPRPWVGRGVAVLPAETTRIVELRTGRPVAELPTPQLEDVQVDRALQLYLLCEPGVLRLLRPGSQLAVV